MWPIRRSRSPACVRAVSYLERGAVSSPQKDTVRLLADALGLIGSVRAEFESHPRPAAGGPRKCAGQPAADRRGRGAARNR
jgi:hypothetical protein